MSNLALRRTAKRKQPIISVRPGQLTRSNQSSRVYQEAMARFSINQNRRFHKIRWSESEIPQDQMVRIGDSRRSDGHNHILRRIDKIGWSESYRPIRSFRQLLNCYIKDRLFGESTRSDCQNRICQSYHLDGYSTVLIGHSHRRHPQVRMVRP